jgi:phenylalanyl-tRNA synthetase beta chain
MLISYNWIKTYFAEPIPEPKELADIITMGAFEIDAMETKGEGEHTDTIFDVKVLPDRAPYALCHRYMAQEIGALIAQPIVTPEIKSVDTELAVSPLLIQNLAGSTPEGGAYCKRYVGRIVEGIEIADSPLWLKSQLEVLGQRSINSIVDLTNYIMLETGQPLHAFDADKIRGPIQVRFAREGEVVELLDGKVLALDTTTLVLADDVGPLDLAGIKGGKRAEVSVYTKKIHINAVCFNQSTIRKTVQKTGIRNESAKRNENGVTPERSGLALAFLSSKIAELNPLARFGEVTDVYENPVSRRNFEVSISYISERLGVQIAKEKMLEILSRIDVVVSTDTQSEDILLLSVPEYRPDLVLQEDIAEEVGRIYGYEKVPGVVPQAESDRRIHKNFYYHNLIKKHLAGFGFSEVYTYTLTEEGDVPLANPLTVDRAYLRNSLSNLISKKGLFNLKNSNLLGLKEVRIFEIGKIFNTKAIAEKFSLALSIAREKQPKGHDPKVELENIVRHIEQILGLPEAFSSIQNFETHNSVTFTELKGDAQTPCVGYVLEVDLEALVERLPEPTEECVMGALPELVFKPISLYPFSVRDIALYVPGEKGKEFEIESVIRESLRGCGTESLLARITLFDVFTKNKEGEPMRTSYAFRLVFQSYEKTLSEEEINSCMSAITAALTGCGFEVR